MNIALVTNNDNMAPLQPGAKFRLESDNNTAISQPREIRAGWFPLVWALDLKQHNVKLLLCDGIKQFMPPTIKGILQQCGIQLVPIVSGSVKEVMGMWRSGRLIIPEPFEAKPQIPEEVRQVG